MVYSWTGAVSSLWLPSPKSHLTAETSPVEVGEKLTVSGAAPSSTSTEKSADGGGIGVGVGVGGGCGVGRCGRNVGVGVRTLGGVDVGAAVAIGIAVGSGVTEVTGVGVRTGVVTNAVSAGTSSPPPQPTAVAPPNTQHINANDIRKPRGFSQIMAPDMTPPVG